MTCTKTNIQDNIKTLRTPWRKRHLEKKLFFCFAVFIKPKYDTCVLQIATPTTLKRTYARHRWNVLIMHDFNYFCHVFFVNIKNLVFMQLTMKTRRLFQFHFFLLSVLDVSLCCCIIFFLFNSPEHKVPSISYCDLIKILLLCNRLSDFNKLYRNDP